MSPAPPPELAPVFNDIRRLTETGLFRHRIIEILLPLDVAPAVTMMGGHVVRHADVPLPAVTIS